jgi:hypothetical protein
VPASRSASERWGRRLLAAGVLLLSWAAFIAASGGFLIDLGVLRISSRNPTRVAAAGTLLVLAAWRLAYREQLRRAASAVPGLLKRTELRFAAVAPGFAHLSSYFAWTGALVLLAIAVVYGGRVAGGADAFGYLSEAALVGAGRLGIDQSFAAALPWPNAAGSFVPIAYRLGAGNVMGPTVAPGLPLLMAVAATLSACGPYLVVPLCGGLLVLATWRLGERLYGAGPALAATALNPTNPTIRDPVIRGSRIRDSG